MIKMSKVLRGLRCGINLESLVTSKIDAVPRLSFKRTTCKRKRKEYLYTFWGFSQPGADQHGHMTSPTRSDHSLLNINRTSVYKRQNLMQHNLSQRSIALSFTVCQQKLSILACCSSPDTNGSMLREQSTISTTIPMRWWRHSTFPKPFSTYPRSLNGITYPPTSLQSKRAQDPFRPLHALMQIALSSTTSLFQAQTHSYHFLRAALSFYGSAFQSSRGCWQCALALWLSLKQEFSTDCMFAQTKSYSRCSQKQVS